MDELVPEVSVSYVRNPDYWNADAYDFDEVTFQAFDDDVAALNALKSGQIDATSLGIPLAVEAEAEGFPIHTGTGTYGTLIIRDRGGEIVPALADLRVRHALNLAFDREAIAETLNLGYGSVSSQGATQGQPEYVEGGDDYYGYDPEKARELLAEAGYPDGFALRIPTSPDTASYEPIVQQALADIGITVEYVPTADGTAWFNAATSGEYAVLLSTWYFVNVVVWFWDPQLPALMNNYVDPTFNDLVSTMYEGTLEESEAAAAEVGPYLLEEAWYAPFSKPDVTWATAPGVDLTVSQMDGRAELLYFTRAE